MIIKKINGQLVLLGGETIDCDLEIDDISCILNAWRNARGTANTFQISEQHVATTFVPTGPVIDSTLAEKDEASDE